MKKVPSASVFKEYAFDKQRRRKKRKHGKMGDAEFLDPTITEEQRETIEKHRMRYSRNLPAFARECLRIIDRDSPLGAEIKPFSLNACQLALHKYIESIKEFNIERSRAMNKRDRSIPITEFPIGVVVLKARKVGVSTYLQLRAFHRCEFYPHNNCLIMAHEASASENILKISKRFDEQFELPEALPIRKPISRINDKLVEWTKDDNNIDSWDSRIVVKTAGTKTSGTSRSFSWHFVHVSEEAHFASSDEVSATLAACVKYCETYEESTAKGTGGLFYDTWQAAMKLEDVRELWRKGEPIPAWWNGKFQFFWSWLDDPAYRRTVEDWEANQILSTLSPTEEDLVKRFNATVEQLAWRRWKLTGECSAQKELDPEDYFHQEYPTEPHDAFVSSGTNAFNQRALLSLQHQYKDKKPLWTGEVLVDIESDPDTAVRLVKQPARDTIKVWEEPDPEADYIMGLDTAEGLQHGDYTVLSIWNRMDDTLLREACRVRGKINPDEIALIAFRLARMYNDAFIVPEANSPGNATCTKLVRLQYPFIYHRDNPEMVSDRHQGDISFTAGFRTSPQNKPLLISDGQDALRNNRIQIFDPAALTEWLHYKNDDGKYAAPKGECDDCVMADLLAIYGHFSGKAPKVRRRSAPQKKGDDAELSREALLMKKAIEKNRKALKLRETLERRGILRHSARTFKFF